MGQIDENDNNKNRKYSIVDRRIRDTYGRDSSAQLTNKLYDAYVKFFRWSIDRLGNRDGVLCFVTNNSFVSQLAFDGMRLHLTQDFNQVFHIDLHGNVRLNPKLSGSTHNVFGIQVGVGITIAVRQKKLKRRLSYIRVPEDWRKEEKLSWLASKSRISGVEWRVLKPDSRNAWIAARNKAAYERFLPSGFAESKGGTSADCASIFHRYSLGVVTNRDDWAYAFRRDALNENMRRMIDNYNYEVFRLSQDPSAAASIDTFVNNDPKFIKWTDRLKEALASGEKINYSPSKERLALFRPYVKQFLYFDHLLNQRRYQQHHIYPTPTSEAENIGITVSHIGFRAPTFSSLATNHIPELHLCASTDGHQCFPFFIYDVDGTNRRENVTDWALKQFRDHYANKRITKWDIFYYVYGVLHHPGYREKFADNLKRELPRIPLAPALASGPSSGKAGSRGSLTPGPSPKGERGSR